jgi:colicin import membrane protein
MATIPFVMVIALVLAVGMVCLLVLTTALQDQTFVVQSRQREAERLSDQLAALQAEIADARSVTHLAVAAQELGMRPNPYGAQLQLPDGTVVGTATAVTGGEIPGLRYLTPEQAEAQLQALAKAEAERTAKLKAEAKAKAEAKKQAEAKKKAEAKAKAEKKAKAEAEKKAKAEAEKKAKAEAEKKAKAEAEAKDKKKGKRP